MSETDTTWHSQQPREQTVRVKSGGGEMLWWESNEGRGAPKEKVRAHSYFLITISVMRQRGRCLRETDYRGPNGIS